MLGWLEKLTDEGVRDEAAVHRCLKDWWLSHILEPDRQYRSFVESTL